MNLLTPEAEERRHELAKRPGMADCRGLSAADADAAFRQYERDLRTAQTKTRAARLLETIQTAMKATP